jgi:hypothetical protein
MSPKFYIVAKSIDGLPTPAIKRIKVLSLHLLGINLRNANIHGRHQTNLDFTKKSIVSMARNLTIMQFQAE